LQQRLVAVLNSMMLPAPCALCAAQHSTIDVQPTPNPLSASVSMPANAIQLGKAMLFQTPVIPTAAHLPLAAACPTWKAAVTYMSDACRRTQSQHCAAKCATLRHELQGLLDGDLQHIY
jgi:hypothetical protein